MASVTADTSTAADRFAAALADPDHLFTRDQLLWVVQLDREARGDDPDEPGFRDLVWRAGYEAGYRARCAEENLTYRADVEDVDQDSGLRRLVETVDARRAADRAARLPRPGDFRGGLPLPDAQGADHDDLKEAA